MLPGHTTRYSGHSIVPEYVRRIVRYSQMDIEYTFWQMFHLCVNPSAVYRTTSYHKQTKNQWARDDPAFVAILIFFMGMASLSYAIAFQAESFFGIIRTMMWSIIVDFLLVGALIATLNWFLANQFLRAKNHLEFSVDQKVEWLYAFDIHCNSFFPLFLILYVFQFFLLPLAMLPSFFATFVFNLLYAVAFGYYFHITFLGFNVLPFLHNTVCFLYPIGGVILVYVLSLMLNFNFCIFVMNLYFGK